MSKDRLLFQLKQNQLVYLLIMIIGIILVSSGFILQIQNNLNYQALYEMSKILGTLFMGLAFGGFVSIFSDDRFAKEVNTLLKLHTKGQIAALDRLFEDHLQSGGHDEPIPDKFRRRLTLYYQTGTDESGKEGLWFSRIVDFSGGQLKKKLFIETYHRDPRPGMSAQKYAVEMLIKRGRIILMETNISDPGEPTSITVFGVPLLNSHAFGVQNHIDWVGNIRLSRAILTSEPLKGLNLQNPDEAKHMLNNMWESSAQGRAIVTAIS